MKPIRQWMPFGLICAGILWPLRGASAQDESTAESIRPPDVYLHVGLLRKELDSIRFVMGRPKNEQPEIDVIEAAPQEVYFQALTMFRKAERLCFEHTREHAAEPKSPTGEILPGDVYEVVDAALTCIRRVKAKLGIVEQHAPPTRDPAKTPTDVFRSTMQANRQLNLLLERQFAPSDVFQQVTIGVGYASRLLEQFPEATTIPDSPEFETGKRPGDVYRRLLVCYERIRRIAKASGLKTLKLTADEARIDAVEPSDVYDVASLLVSELAYLHAHLDGAKQPRKVYYVGRKFPSHVYQRAGILELQLIELEKWVQEKPGWLTRRNNSQ